MVYLDFAGFKRRNQTFEAMGLEPERGFRWTRTIRQAEGSILFLDISETFASHMTPAPTQLTGPAQVLPRRCWADFLVSRRLGGQASMHSFHKHKVVGEANPPGTSVSEMLPLFWRATLLSQRPVWGSFKLPSSRMSHGDLMELGSDPSSSPWIRFNLSSHVQTFSVFSKLVSLEASG